MLVDATPPDTLIAGAPSDPSNEITPTIRFAGDDGSGSGIASFECNLDGAGWNSCPTPYTTPSLSEGNHTLEARAIDNVGLVDSTPVSHTWEVDLTPPSAPTLLSPADGELITGTDQITLTWTEVVTPEAAIGYYVTFVDGIGGISVDTNQYVSGHMDKGVYSWTVAAQDAAGNLSDTPSPWSFTLVPSDATTTIDPSQPVSLTQSSPGGQITVEVPAGAVSEETILAYTGVTTPSQSMGNLQFAGQAFSLDAIQNDELLDGLTFQSPVTLTIEYTDADVDGLDEGALELFSYDDAAGEWSTDGITVVERDTANNTIVVTITHLTDFALFRELLTIHLPLVFK